RAHPEVRKVFGDAAVVQKDKRKRQVIFGQFLKRRGISVYKGEKTKAGIALPLVLLFIAIMAVAGLIMVSISIGSMQNARIIPEFDSHFYAAEAAINRAMPAIVAEFSGEHEVIAANSIRTSTQNRINHPNFPVDPNNPTGVIDTTGWLMGCNIFMDSIQDAISSFVIDSLGGFERIPPINAGLSTARNLISDYFWLVGEWENGRHSAAEGFGVPAFVNFLRRENSDALHVGLIPSNIIAESPVLESYYNITPNFIRSRYRINLAIAPYITFTSKSGTVEISESVLLPFEDYSVYFYIDTVTTSEGNNSPFVNASSQGHKHIGENVMVNGNPAPPPAQINALSEMDGFRNSIRQNALQGHSGNWGDSAVGVTTRNLGGTNNTIERGSDGRIRIHDGATWGDWESIGQNLVIYNTWGNLTLVGDFTGINFYGIGVGNLILGTETQRFNVQNTLGNETYIFSPGNVSVNVADGLIMERVSIGADGAMNFASLGTPGGLSIGAIFTSQGHMTGTITASEWNAQQVPQFYGRQGITMTMQSPQYLPMGGLFASADGGHLRITIENSGADFVGLFAGNQSADGYVQGMTNITTPFFSTMPMMPQLSRELSFVSGENSIGGYTTHTRGHINAENTDVGGGLIRPTPLNPNQGVRLM
ncbi:MAG: hypothetical protein FWF81_08675, partial [Defluviitaleaceae bacterium]|nr:hypothetical protein [Defluviitaleaceae bacterium]